MQKLINESRKVSNRITLAIREYIAKHKSLFLETSLAVDNNGDIVLDGVEYNDVYHQRWVEICTDNFYESYENVMVMGIEYSEEPYTGGARVYYLRPDEDKLSIANLSDVSVKDYVTLLELLMFCTPLNIKNLPQY